MEKGAYVIITDGKAEYPNKVKVEDVLVQR